MRLLFRLLLVVPVLFACEPRTQPSAPTFEASIPKPLAKTADEALRTREDGLGLPVGAGIPSFHIAVFLVRGGKVA